MDVTVSPTWTAGPCEGEIRCHARHRRASESEMRRASCTVNAWSQGKLCGAICGKPVGDARRRRAMNATPRAKSEGPPLKMESRLRFVLCRTGTVWQSQSRMMGAGMCDTKQSTMKVKREVLSLAGGSDKAGRWHYCPGQSMTGGGLSVQFRKAGPAQCG